MMAQAVEKLEKKAKAKNWSPEKKQKEIQALQDKTKKDLQRGAIKCGQ